MVNCKCGKQAGKAQKILEKLENTKIKSKIYYLSHIFKTVNMRNCELQDKKNQTCLPALSSKRLDLETKILENTI